MILKRIKDSSDKHFQKAWKLYEDAFPFEERRPLKDQIVIFKNDKYHFDVLIEENEFIGFMLWWDFEEQRFIEYFATKAEFRNKGLGKSILNTFIKTSPKPILLEVELPTSSINKRRIKFYERLGFKLNQHYYEVPSAIINDPPLQFLLMTYPEHISAKDVEQFVKKMSS